MAYIRRGCIRCLEAAFGFRRNLPFLLRSRCDTPPRQTREDREQSASFREKTRHRWEAVPGLVVCRPWSAALYLQSVVRELFRTILEPPVSQPRSRPRRG